MTPAACIARAREFAAEATGREPTDGEVALALAIMLAIALPACSAGYTRERPRGPTRMPKAPPPRLLRCRAEPAERSTAGANLG